MFICRGFSSYRRYRNEGLGTRRSRVKTTLSPKSFYTKEWGQGEGKPRVSLILHVCKHPSSGSYLCSYKTYFSFRHHSYYYYHRYLTKYLLESNLRLNWCVCVCTGEVVKTRGLTGYHSTWLCHEDLVGSGV